MKKALALILAVVFVCSFSACTTGNNPQITADEALEIALEQAGVSRDSIRNLENNLERDDGVLVYEIDFDAGTTEYSYDVNAETGAIVERDRERLD